MILALDRITIFVNTLSDKGVTFPTGDKNISRKVFLLKYFTVTYYILGKGIA